MIIIITMDSGRDQFKVGGKIVREEGIESIDI